MRRRHRSRCPVFPQAVSTALPCSRLQAPRYPAVMPRNVYWELFYHLVWRTKDSAPYLTPEVERLTDKYLIHRALETTGAIVHAVGGIEDHRHMALSLPPTVEIAKWIGDLKGACSHHVNHGPCGAGAL